MRRAFTLIELLVVVAVIAVLMAILLPSLAAAREQAQRVVCTHNIKKLAEGIMFYANDSDDRLPSANWLGYESATWPGSNVPIGGWLYSQPLAVVPGNTALNLKNTMSGKLWPYERDSRLYRCPRDRGGWPTTWDYQVEWLTSYTVNGAIINYGGTTIPHKLSEFLPDRIVIWETDERLALFNDAANFPSEGITRRHGEGATVGRFDGAAEYMKRKAFIAEAARRPGRLWCMPNSDWGG